MDHFKEHLSRDKGLLANKLHVKGSLGPRSTPVGVQKYHFLKKVVKFTLLVSYLPFQMKPNPARDPKNPDRTQPTKKYQNFIDLFNISVGLCILQRDVKSKILKDTFRSGIQNLNWMGSIISAPSLGMRTFFPTFPLHTRS